MLDAVRGFARGMHRMREHLALVEQLRYGLPEAAVVPGGGRACIATAISVVRRTARRGRSWVRAGSSSLRDYLADYAESDRFGSLVERDAGSCRSELAAVSYAVHIKGNRVRVSRYEGEPDISEEVERTFAKFKQGAVKDYRVRFREQPEMNHVEAQILELVAKLHPETFCAARRSTARATAAISTRRSAGLTARCSSTSRTWSTSSR